MLIIIGRLKNLTDYEEFKKAMVDRIHTEPVPIRIGRGGYGRRMTTCKFMLPYHKV